MAAPEVSAQAAAAANIIFFIINTLVAMVFAILGKKPLTNVCACMNISIHVHALEAHPFQPSSKKRSLLALIQITRHKNATKTPQKKAAVLKQPLFTRGQYGPEN